MVPTSPKSICTPLPLENEMSANFRRLLLRFNAVFLILAGVGAWLRLDFPAAFSGSGPLSPLIAHEPSLAIGFVEAHGFALIFGVLLWRAPTAIQWHLTGAAIHLLLGASNIGFWQIFVATNTLPMGRVTTVLHGLLCALHVFAAIAAARAAQDAIENR
jgi:hypothetical protein